MKNETAGSQHPSFLALERHTLGVAPPEVAAHVAACDSCRARLPAAPPASVVPAWARQLPPRRRPWFVWPLSTRPRALGFTAAALACFALVWTIRGKEYIGTKGGPELWLYVKRGEQVALWNGTDAVVPGDLLRLKVQPDRFKHVTVFGAAKTPGENSPLYDGVIAPGEPTALPFSLKVDGQPGDETLLVVLGDGEKREHRWSRRLVLSKTIAAPARDGAPP